MITIKQATTPEEILEITKLRYAIYVEEMRVYSGSADHENQILTDEYDQTDRILYAHNGSEIVGAISLVVGADGPMRKELADIYDVARFDNHLDQSKMGATIRLMVKPAFRKSSLPFKLIVEGAKVFVEAGCELTFCTCQPHLLNMYNRLGFESYSVDIQNDPEFGIMVPLVLVMGDQENLKSIGSPLKSVFAEGSYNLSAIDGIRMAMGSTSAQKASSENLGADWAEFYGILNEPERENALLFDGLNDNEIKEVIDQGHIIECHAGDKVIKMGQVTRTVFVPLTGILEVRVKSRLVAVVPTGEMIGEQAFLLGSRRTADCYAGKEGAQVLCLNENILHQIIEKPGRIGTALLLNISKSLALRLAHTTAAAYNE